MWLEQGQDKDIINKAFDYIITTNDEMNKPDALLIVGQSLMHNSNSNKHKIFEYSPFEQTLLLDIDYIVKTDILLKYFDTDKHVIMFDNALTLRNELSTRKNVV